MPMVRNAIAYVLALTKVLEDLVVSGLWHRKRLPPSGVVSSLHAS